MKIHCLYDEMTPLKDLKPHPKNRNSHGSDQIERLAKIIDYQGQRAPIVVSSLSGYIVKGHGTLQAIKKLKWETCAVSYQDFENDDIEYAFLISDNSIASWSELDISAINTDIGDLGPDFDIDLLGIKNFEIDVADKYQGDPDAIPDVPKEPKSKLGDLYILGNHRVYCGDATNPQHYEILTNGITPLLMATDPPYGVKLDQSWRDDALGDRKLNKGNSNLILNDDRADWSDAYSLFNGNIAYVWHASSYTDVVKRNLDDCGFDVRQMIIWNKSILVLGRGAYHWKHEPCWYAVRKNENANWLGNRSQTTVWDAASPNHIMSGSKDDKTEHPSQKPIILFETPIINHCGPNDYVYDPFGGSGSGSALIAAEKNNRKSLIMELDPKFLDCIISRYVKFTGNNKVIRNGENITWEGQS